MAKGTIGGKIVLEGESQYREALKNIKAEQAELRSEMKLSKETFAENQNALEALKEQYEILGKQIDKQKEKIDVYRNAVEASSKKEQETAERVEDLKEALEKAEKKMQVFGESAEVTADTVEMQKREVEDLKQKLSFAETAYDKAARKTSSYRTALNNANAELQSMQNELSQTEAYVKEAENATDRCAVSIDRYGKALKEAEKDTSVFGDVLKANIVSEAVEESVDRICEGVKRIAEKAIDSGSSFEEAMSQVAATMEMTEEEVKNGSEGFIVLSEAAKKCGKETRYSATQAGEALNYLALAGYDAQKAAETLPKTLTLAAAGNMDLAYTSDLVTDSMAAMNMETDMLDNYIDQMAKTSQKSNTSIAQLGEATLVCAGTVTLAGQSLETMNTELGVLANNGIKGAEGGTHLRNIILSLIAPTDIASVAIQNLGLQITDSQGEMRDLNAILTDMNKAMEGMTSEEKTKIISRIFNQTDISAVNALLKGTGKEYNKLYQEISHCDGAAQKMADTLNNNLKGKVTILKSALEGLGISVYEIFDDGMKKTVDKATESVGRLQKSVESGDMRVSLDKLSTELGEFCENAFEMGEEALPVLIDGLTWLLDNGDIVAASVTGIVAANMQMKVVGPIISKATDAWLIYKAANEKATVTQWLLNTAMSANPAGLLITAIVALTAAVAAYAIINRDNISGVDEVTRATKEQTEAAKELNEQLKTSKGDRETARKDMETEAVVCGKLVNELKQLEAKTKLTVSEQHRMKIIVEQLNQIVPELNLSIDDQTGKLNMSTKAIEQNVESMMAMARAEAAREDLVKIAEDQYEAEKMLADLQEQLVEQKERVAEAQERLNEEYEKYGGKSGEAFRSFNKTVIYAHESALSAQKDLEEQIEATQSSITGFTAEYEKTMAYISDTESMAEASAAMSEMGGAAAGAGAQMTGMSVAAREALKSTFEGLQETVSGQMSLFDEFKSNIAITSDEILKNMQSQIDGISAWADNLSLLAEKGIDQGLLKHLVDMGPEGAGYVAAFVEMTDEELRKANELFEESLSIPTEATEKIAEAYATAGEMAVTGFVEGLSENAEKANEASAEVGKGAVEFFNQSMEIHSPSRATQKSAKDFIEGFVTGILMNKMQVLNNLSGLGMEMITLVKNKLKKDTFREIGKQIPEGIIQGIESGRSGVEQAITRMCTAAVSRAKAELEINSPSKKFDYMGEMSGEGYIGGWQRSMKNINSVISKSLPDTSVGAEKRAGTERGFYDSEKKYPAEGIVGGNTVYQTVNVYAPMENPIEAARVFRQAQREAAQEW